MQDKRKHKRYNARWKAALAYMGTTKKPIFHTLTHDLSILGTSVQSNTEEEANTVLTMLLIPPPINGEVQKVVKLKAVVMSSRPFRNGYRLGLNFVHDAELEKLWAILKSLDLSGDSLPSDPDVPHAAEPATPAPAAAALAAPAAPAAPAAAAAPAAPAAPAAAGGKSVLELIKQRAAEKKAAEEQSGMSKEEQQKVLFKKISDTLMQAYTYLTDLAKNLDELKPVWPLPYALPAAADISGLAWIEGRTNCIARPATDGSKVFNKISLNFELGNKEPQKIVKESHAAQRAEAALKEVGLEYLDQAQRNANGVTVNVTFTVKRSIKVGVTVTCDDETGKLYLETRNLERFGTLRYELEMEALNQALLDQLTLLIMGEPNTFAKMMKRVL